MVNFETFISMIFATMTAMICLITAMVWVRLGNKVTDHNVQSTFLAYALVVLLLSASEITFVVRNTLGLKGDAFEYLQYAFIFTGFATFMFAAKLQLELSKTYGVFMPSLARKAKERGEALTGKKTGIIAIDRLLLEKAEKLIRVSGIIS